MRAASAWQLAAAEAAPQRPCTIQMTCHCARRCLFAHCNSRLPPGSEVGGASPSEAGGVAA